MSTTGTRQKTLKTKVEREKDNLVGVLVREPNYRQIQEGQKVHNKAFREALDSGAILRDRVLHYMREQKLWDDDKQKQFDEFRKTLEEGETKLKRGKIKLGEAKQIAFAMQDARAGLRILTIERMGLDNATVEAQAENARFNYYVSACTLYEDTGHPVFRSLEDYLARATEEVAFEAASLLAGIIHNYDEENEKKLPENSFLLKYKLADDKLRLVDKNGNFIDRVGRLVDEQGRLIKVVDGVKTYVDRDGNPLDEKGERIIDDAGPFLDDETNEPLV